MIQSFLNYKGGISSYTETILVFFCTHGNTSYMLNVKHMNGNLKVYKFISIVCIKFQRVDCRGLLPGLFPYSTWHIPPLVNYIRHPCYRPLWISKTHSHFILTSILLIWMRPDLTKWVINRWGPEELSMAKLNKSKGVSQQNLSFELKTREHSLHITLYLLISWWHRYGYNLEIE